MPRVGIEPTTSRFLTSTTASRKKHFALHFARCLRTHMRYESGALPFLQPSACWFYAGAFSKGLSEPPRQNLFFGKENASEKKHRLCRNAQGKATGRVSCVHDTL